MSLNEVFPPTEPLAVPPVTGTNASVVAAGRPIPAIDRIRLMSDSEWEDFVAEWASSLNDRYQVVERCGGAGDMGRDVIAIVEEADDVWDNYQCKHYKAGLTPGDIWLELGKLMYYTYIGEFSVPRRYVFVAPQGVGTKLSNFLRQPEMLKELLREKWKEKCRDKITTTKSVRLDGEFANHIEQFDFSIFQALPPLKLIDEHRETPYHVARFGGGLPPRPELVPPPPKVQDDEAPYIDQLFDAYSDYLDTNVNKRSDLALDSKLSEHFDNARIDFYSAEALRSFSRDHLPDGEFRGLQAQFHRGIQPVLDMKHPDGLERLNRAALAAHQLQVQQHTLSSVLSVFDRGGICHQLSNDGLISWVVDHD